MIDALSHKAKSLSFGTLLYHIFSSVGIFAPPTEIQSTSSFEDLTASTLRKMGYKEDKHGDWVLKHPQTPRVAPTDIPKSSQAPVQHDLLDFSVSL